MNIPDQLQKIGVFLAQDGFIAILKKVSGPSVSSVEITGVSGQQSTHNGCDGNLSGS